MGKIERLKKLKEYQNFEYLETPQLFKELFKGQNISYVGLFDSHFIPAGSLDLPVGYVGKFKWENDEITPLDGDSYTADMLVIGTRKFEKNGLKGIDVLIEGNW